jgi:hypothetical protein
MQLLPSGLPSACEGLQGDGDEDGPVVVHDPADLIAL